MPTLTGGPMQHLILVSQDPESNYVHIGRVPVHLHPEDLQAAKQAAAQHFTELAEGARAQAEVIEQLREENERLKGELEAEREPRGVPVSPAARPGLSV